MQRKTGQMKPVLFGLVVTLSSAEVRSALPIAPAPLELLGSVAWTLRIETEDAM